jgi:hypothetical protein
MLMGAFTGEACLCEERSDEAIQSVVPQSNALICAKS